MSTLTCPKCQGEMEAGFMVDQTYGGVATPEWVEGPVEVSFWYGVKMRGKDRKRVETFRCAACGYLEAYARDVAH